jgi:hypothetical protein
VSPAAIVDRNLAAYAASDLDTLAATLSDDVVMGAFNGKVFAEGRAAAREAYARTIAAYPMNQTQALQRAVVGSTVIDLERSTRASDGRQRDVVTIYRIADAAISRITTSVSDAPPTAGALALIGRQLDAYNAQAIEAYMACFAPDCVIADLDGPVTETGAPAIRHRYANLFQRFPQNRAELLARFGAGALVVDHERVSRSPGGESFECAAFYTIAGDTIARVDFVK